MLKEAFTIIKALHWTANKRFIGWCKLIITKVTESRMNRLQDVMTTSVITIEPEQSVGQGLGIMEQRKISALVVARDKKPLGIFTERALIQILRPSG